MTSFYYPPALRLPALWTAAGVAVYLLAPGNPASVFGGWPLTPAGAAALVMAVATAGIAYRMRADLPSAGAASMALLAALVALRVVLSSVYPEPGWLARYYANDSWHGDPEWSSEYRGRDATRIDRALSFGASGFPTHYLNGASYGEGAEREVSEPMTIEWQGAFQLDAPAVLSVDLRAAGTAVLDLDGEAIAAGQTTTPELGAGRHLATLRYQKAAGVEGTLHLSLRHTSGAPIAVFTPSSSSLYEPPLLRAIAIGIDVLVGALLLLVMLQVALAAWRVDRAQAMVEAVALGGLGVQGFVTALPLAARFQTLTGGDDWLGFESRARDILQHGPLMTLGEPLGQGAAYFYHPFYSYALAAIHALTGESLFGPIFIQFLWLGATALLMWSLVRGLFGTASALVAFAALMLIFEVDFIRYYTITLLSENLYVLTVTLCLTAFARWAQTGRTSLLIYAGLWGGLSAATRPAMMMFLFPAIAVTYAIAFRQRRGWWPLQATLIAVASWMVVVLPFTLRNWVVARKLVLISDGLGGTFIFHNVPAPIDPAQYMDRFRGGIMNGLAVLWQLFVEHPLAVTALLLKKLGFTLGMIHWFDGYRPHPELVAVSVLYIAMLAWSPVLRRAELWPMHAFVAAHVASMFLTSPWNYGYRLILPPFVYTTTLSVAAAAALLGAARAARAGHS